LSPQAKAILDNIAWPLTNPPLATTRIVVTGHTDTVGGKAANLALSRRRALSVRDYLLHIGVDASRIELQAMGESDPIISAEEGSDETYNRGVSVLEMVSPEEADRRLAARPKGVVC
jgi:outer membrane protein OmpA-like peptidoglycan-associated protein